jgi:hypothetical protein
VTLKKFNTANSYSVITGDILEFIIIIAKMQKDKEKQGNFQEIHKLLTFSKFFFLFTQKQFKNFHSSNSS